MIAILYAMLFLLFAGALFWLFLTTPPKQLANYISKAVPAGLVLFGGLLLLLGRGAIGLPMIVLGYGWWQRTRRMSKFSNPSGGQKSTVRSPDLEMVLDHDSGEMNGRILSGRYKNKWLADLKLENLLDFYNEIGADQENAALLEAYLDRSFPDWREHEDANFKENHAGASTSGTMTRLEAYQVLGLEPGASEKEISSAWRKLMKGMHPDSGGSEFLATKINAARDVLLD